MRVAGFASRLGTVAPRQATRRQGFAKFVGLAAPLLLLGLLSTYVFAVMWEPHEIVRIAPQHPAVVAHPRIAVTFPGRHLIARAGEYGDELDAYQAVLNLRETAGPAVPIAATRSTTSAAVFLELPDDLLKTVPVLERLRGTRVGTTVDWAVTQREQVSDWREESLLFEEIYGDLPRRRSASTGPPAHIVRDIVAIARFYDLSPRFFRPVPYPQRLPASRWTQYPGANHAVLLRNPAGTLVVENDSVEWQEVLDALIHAQALVDADRRDYASLPDRLQPSRRLDLEKRPDALFTYAGVLLRHLVDKAGGENLEAITARADRPDNPNVRYDPGVRRAAMYARRVLTHALHVNRLHLLSQRGVLSTGW